jgi:hypothetical protein
MGSVELEVVDWGWRGLDWILDLSLRKIPPRAMPESVVSATSGHLCTKTGALYSPQNGDKRRGGPGPPWRRAHDGGANGPASVLSQKCIEIEIRTECRLMIRRRLSAMADRQSSIQFVFHLVCRADWFDVCYSDGPACCYGRPLFGSCRGWAPGVGGHFARTTSSLSTLPSTPWWRNVRTGRPSRRSTAPSRNPPTTFK